MIDRRVAAVNGTASTRIEFDMSSIQLRVSGRRSDESYTCC